MVKAAGSKEKQATLRIAKRLNKFIALPSFLNWKVHESDILHRGRVLCMIRSKRTFLPDDVSLLKMRVTTVTKHGFMVLYEKVDQGLVIDLRSASHVLTDCDKYKTKKAQYSRSHIKIRLPRGNVHFFVRDDDIPKWTAAILAAHVSAQERPLPKKESAVPHHSEPMTAVEDIADAAPSSPTTSSNSGLITVIERAPHSDCSQIQSVRQGHISVDLLRRRLEKSLPVGTQTPTEQPPNPVKEEPKFITSLFVLHEGVPIDQDKEKDLEAKMETGGQESSGKEPKKEWWMRSLRC